MLTVAAELVALFHDLLCPVSMIWETCNVPSNGVHLNHRQTLRATSLVSGEIIRRGVLPRKDRGFRGVPNSS